MKLLLDKDKDKPMKESDHPMDFKVRFKEPDSPLEFVVSRVTTKRWWSDVNYLQLLICLLLFVGIFTVGFISHWSMTRREALKMNDQTVTLEAKGFHGSEVGSEVDSEVCPDIQSLEVTIMVHNATVPQMDKTFSTKADPYIRLYVMDINGRRFMEKSHYVKNTMAPKWSFTFDPIVVLKNSTLDFQLFDWDSISEDDWVGEVHVQMEDVLNYGQNGQMMQKKYGDDHYLWITVRW